MSDLLPERSTVSRRSVLRAGAGALAAAMIPEPLHAEARREDFTFVVANDLHYRDQRCDEWFEQVVASIRALRPRPAFVVLNGDLSENGTREQLGAVREIFGTLPMPFFTTIGNHDYTEAGSRESYEQVFGRTLNYRFDHGGWQFLALNSANGRGVYRTWVPGETLGWLRVNLPHIPRDRPMVMITHFPHGRNWLRPLNARDVMERLEEHNLREVICGHWHGWTERNERGVRCVTGRCCSWWRKNHDKSELKGYFLCRAGESDIDYEFIAVGPGNTITRQRRLA